MRRREFITLLGGAAAAWPLAARAQQPDRMRRIGALFSQAETDPEGQARAAALQQGLQEFGWAEGRNLRFEYRWTGGGLDGMRPLAAEQVQLALSRDGQLDVEAFEHMRALGGGDETGN